MGQTVLSFSQRLYLNTSNTLSEGPSASQNIPVFTNCLSHDK